VLGIFLHSFLGCVCAALAKATHSKLDAVLLVRIYTCVSYWPTVLILLLRCTLVSFCTCSVLKCSALLLRRGAFFLSVVAFCTLRFAFVLAAFGTWCQAACHSLVAQGVNIRGKTSSSNKTQFRVRLSFSLVADKTLWVGRMGANNLKLWRASESASAAFS
jgi:hypothetical protein